MTISIKHSHGLTESHADLDAALVALRSVYGQWIVTEGELGVHRMLVWQDEASAENDDGARAVAEIRESHE